MCRVIGEDKTRGLYREISEVGKRKKGGEKKVRNQQRQICEALRSNVFH